MVQFRSIIQGLLLCALAGCGAVALDISPDLSNANPGASPSNYAGLTVALAGNEQMLYAVSMNAGIWAASNGGAWQQLANSPKEAQTISVDPNNVSHVIVGERAGRSPWESLNQSGVWVSLDGGKTPWQYLLNPLTAGCGSQVITSVLIDSQSNEFAATTCGVFRRKFGETSFSLMAGTNAPTGQINGLAAASNGHSMPWIWARTQDDFFLYKEESDTWEMIAIPSVVEGTSITRGRRGDNFALAAHDSKALTVVSVDQPLPAGSDPTTCPAGTIGITSVLTYDEYSPAGQQWTVDKMGTGDGTGIGGRRFIKAYERGAGAELFVGGAQNIYWGEFQDLMTTWKEIAETPYYLGPCGHYDMKTQSTIHTDTWDLHLGSASPASYWISSDGGVYRGNMSDVRRAAIGYSPAYVQQNQGLHTHHIHKLSVVADSSNNNQEARLIYPTSDNDSWSRDIASVGNGPWTYLGVQGDTNSTYSDIAGPTHAMSYRDPINVLFDRFSSPQDLCSNGANAKDPLCAGGAFTLQTDPPNQSGADLNYEYFNVVQTQSSETSSENLDVLMLVNQYNPVTGIKPILMRSRTFSTNPDANVSKLAAPTWATIDSKLPTANASRIWSSGGHSGTTFFLYGGGPFPTLWRGSAGGDWTEITAEIGATLNSNYEGMGPAFVDPYLVGRIFVLTTVGVSFSAGNDFQSDDVLTALITESGSYLISGSYTGAVDNIIYYDSLDDHGNQTGSRALTMASLEHMAFDPANPNHFVAAAPYAGAFYSNAGVWHDLTPLLPTPLPAVSSVAITGRAIYVATEGRGLYEILNYDQSPLASYFLHNSSLSQGELARLMGADGSHASGRKVNVTLAEANGASIISQSTATTDATGAIPIPSDPGDPTNFYVIHLQFAGVPGYAPAGAHFFFSFSR